MAATDYKSQLFDFQIVCEIVTAAVILYLIEEEYEDDESVNEDTIADFVINHFSKIMSTITDDENVSPECPGQ